MLFWYFRVYWILHQIKVYEGKLSDKRGRGRPRLIFEITVSTDTGGRSRKKHEDPPMGMYEEVDDNGRGGRGAYKATVTFDTLFSLTTLLGIPPEA